MSYLAPSFFADLAAYNGSKLSLLASFHCSKGALWRAKELVVFKLLITSKELIDLQSC